MTTNKRTIVFEPNEFSPECVLCDSHFVDCPNCINADMVEYDEHGKEVGREERFSREES